MARSNDEKPDVKASAGAKKKRAPAPKPAPRAKKSGPAAKTPANKRAPARTAKNGKAAAAPANAKSAAGKPRKPAPRAAAPKPAPAARKPAPPRRPRRVTPVKSAPTPVGPLPEPVVAAELGEEERIEDAKYLPRERPARAFEEERFLFPETYGENRVRLLVKDPEWLFAHWDVAPTSLEGLRSELGERTAALSRLTLRIRDPQHGGTSVILLPEGVRTWYVKADHAPRAYRAELGFTLPSGEFRVLAESNTVSTPWAGSSGERPGRRVRFDGTSPRTPGGAEPGSGPGPGPGRATSWPPGSTERSAPGPWAPEPATQIGGQPEPEAPESAGSAPGPGGASDVYRR